MEVKILSKTINLGIEGMTCAACAQRIEKTLNKDPNIFSAVVNLATESGKVAFNPAELTEADIYNKIKKIGYIPVKEKADQEAIAKKEFQLHRARLIVAIILSIPLLLSMLDHLPFSNSMSLGLLMNPWFQMVPATIVQFVIGAPFYVSAYRAVRGGLANMDVLVVLGTSVAYGLSVVNTLRYQFGHLHHPVLYFETSAVLITFVLLGKYLEKRAKNQTTAAITSLIQLQPNEAIVLADGIEKEISIQSIKLGDIVKVVPGQKMPVDGKIIKGTTTVDESLLTGESLPIDKKLNDSVIAGSINQNGAILVEVTRIGQETTLSQIIKIIENAQGDKVPIQRLADKISSIFVPAVIAVSILTFSVWIIVSGDFYMAINGAVSVLVIACPCALGLATPTAIMVGSGASAKHGILFKGGQYLENLEKVETVVFDKTGTLTTGQPEVVSADYPDLSTLSLIVSAEANSEHPLSKAILRYGKQMQLELAAISQFEALPGFGISALINQKAVLIGNRNLMLNAGVDLQFVDDGILSHENQGKTLVFAAINQKHIATFAIRDKIKPESKLAVKRLTELGKKVVMLSGDNLVTARAIAKEIGIGEVVAEVLPGEKAEQIKRLQANQSVAMIGDGVNDAPALVTSDVGIAMGTGSDVAIESADVTLVSGEVTKVVDAVQISKQTMKTIRENLFWALIYNLIGIPIAASGLLAPWLAGAAMAFSSISVVLNSLRLKFIVEKNMSKQNKN